MSSKIAVIAAGLLVSTSLGVVTPAVAREKIDFRIPAGDLGSALESYGTRTGRQILFDPATVRNRTTAGVSGALSADAALEQILFRTGLDIIRNGDGVIVLRPARVGTITKATLVRQEPAPTSAGRPSGASQPTDSSATQPAQAGGIAEIVVTAQKRAENVQDMPIAIDALNGDSILERRIDDPTDLIAEFPNLSLKQSSSINVGISIRGVGTQNYHLTAQQAVGQYLDEVSLVTPFSSTLGLYDLERVEVLRGPQNTLFGRNTTGGAMNYISRKPDPGEGFNGYARANAGRFDKFDLEGAVGLPLSDTVAIRLAGQLQTRDGAFRDVATGDKLGSTKRYGGRVAIGWQPGPDTEVILSGHVGYSRGSRMPQKASGYYEPDGVTPCSELSTGTDQFREANRCVGRRKDGTTVNPSLDRWRDVYNTGSSAANVDFEGGYLRSYHSFGSVGLTNISSFDQTKVKFGDDQAGTPYIQFHVFQDALYKIYSHETRLASEGSGPIKWVAGGFWSHENDKLATIVRNNAFGPPGYAVTPMVSLDQKGDILSFYGQVDGELTDRLNAGLGLRWTSDKRKGLRNVVTVLDSETGLAGSPRLPSDFFISRAFLERLSADFTTPCAAGITGCRGPLVELKQNLGKVAGKASIDYEIADDVMVYASYSRGFKSGSFDIRAQGAFNGTGNTPVRPEVLDAYEIGLKSQVLNRMIQFNAAAFLYDWKDLQTFGAIPGLGPAFLNIPKARLKGVEAELKIAPGGGLEVNLAGSYLDSEVVDIGNLGPTTAVVGAPLQQSPRWSFNGRAEKSFDIGRNELTASVSGRYTGKQYTDLTQSAYSYIDPAFFVDTSLNLSFGPDLQHEIALYVDNVTSEKTCYFTLAAPGLTNVNTCIPNEGTAIYGMTLTTRW